MIAMEVDSGVVQNHSCHTVRSICALSFMIPYTQLSPLNSSSDSASVLHNASHFAGAHDFIPYGGTYNNIPGNYIVSGGTNDSGLC